MSWKFGIDLRCIPTLEVFLNQHLAVNTKWNIDIRTPLQINMFQNHPVEKEQNLSNLCLVPWDLWGCKQHFKPSTHEEKSVWKDVFDYIKTIQSIQNIPSCMFCLHTERRHDEFSSYLKCQPLKYHEAPGGNTAQLGNLKSWIFSEGTLLPTEISIWPRWVWPLPSNSDHQDYYIFSRESRNKPLFATGILGRGHTQCTHVKKITEIDRTLGHRLTSDSKLHLLDMKTHM